MYIYIYIYYSNMCIIYYTIKYKTEHIMWCISTVQKRSSQRARPGPFGASWSCACQVIGVCLGLNRMGNDIISIDWVQ